VLQIAYLVGLPTNCGFSQIAQQCSKRAIVTKPSNLIAQLNLKLLWRLDKFFLPLQ